jgi:hypothetical protein
MRRIEMTEINNNLIEETTSGKKFKVPLALDNNDELIQPVDAVKGQEYRCPLCHDMVILRKGNIKVAHFAHHISSTCTSETILHLTAKMLIQKAVKTWRSGESSAPVTIRKCKICDGDLETPLNKQVTDAILEYRLSNGLIADVALMTNNNPIAAVEIRVTHAVDKKKAGELQIPFIELNGEDVIKDHYTWRAIAHNSQLRVCANCKDIYKKFMIKVSNIASNTNITLPTEFYRYSICSCYRCKKHIIVFTWPKENDDDDENENTEIVLPKPMPRTLQYRYSKMAHSKYLANTCPYCNALQGDFFLHSEPEAPFFCMGYDNNFSTDFTEDILKFAQYASELGLLDEK